MFITSSRAAAPRAIRAGAMRYGAAAMLYAAARRYAPDVTRHFHARRRFFRLSPLMPLRLLIIVIDASLRHAAGTRHAYCFHAVITMILFFLIFLLIFDFFDAAFFADAAA